MILDKSICNWIALRKYLGDKIIKRCDNRKPRDSIFSKKLSTGTLQKSCKSITQTQIEVYFEECLSRLEWFIKVDPIRKGLEIWLR